MRTFALVALLAASTCWAQEPASNPAAPAAAQKQTITIPVGTRIPLALASPIRAKSARPGNAVRAVTGSPVTVGTQLAIPVGTYVESVIDKVTKGGRWGPSLQMHFTRILYANGYSVAIDGANVQAQVHSPPSSSPERAALAGESGPGNALTSQPSTGSPALPNTGQTLGTTAAVTAGIAVVAIVTAAVLHRHGGSSGVVFDTGWQFEMVLQSPLSVDTASIAAPAGPGAH